MDKPTTKLLCTFSQKHLLLSTMKEIYNNYDVYNKKLYIYECNFNKEDLYLIYSVLFFESLLPNTISIHRKKESNTYFTINALNCLVAELNNGICDPKYQIDWNEYQNSLILMNDGIVRYIGIKFKEDFCLKDKK